MAQRFNIYVRFNSNSNIPVLIDMTWSIRQLKEELGRQQSVDPRGIRIIFAGRELKDSTTLQDCEIPNQSIIHAIHGGRQTVNVDASATMPLASINLSAESGDPRPMAASAGSSAHGKKAMYYVYCRQCKSAQPGKLRVCCSSCKEGTLVLKQDPGGWDDVLQPGRIKGTCQKAGCKGETAEFFFKCAAHPVSEDERSVPLFLIRTNTRNVPCLACEDIVDPVLVFPCEVGHAICLDCFEIYCTTKLNDRQFIQHRDHGYTLPCPGDTESCSDALITEAHHFRVLGQEQYDRYQRFGTEECVLQMGGVLCPGRGCGMGLFPAAGARSVHCQGGCNLTFCRECKGRYERGHKCQTQTRPSTRTSLLSRYRVSRESARRSCWEQEDQEAQDLIRRISKPCPKCNVPTEKSGGCNHMSCSRCKFDWCWLCGIQWNPECQGNHWFLQERYRR
ncbi:E3 ubiquitin-protein ligase parkin isoform X2 [Nematostella vectensis]|uniref:E3 ubiquitin-protein ligase parkin isoform X2 n=1 Tax=Nematostella vectensis TaxID=45351 RepID=UPI0013902062|nr:E3 ubiquitin-protein ligase parkin isoform X2 [Nematostella vectensis]